MPKEMDKKELRLNSPAGGDPVIYQWPLPKVSWSNPVLDVVRSFVTFLVQAV